MKLQKTIEESTKEIEELSEMESLLRRVMLLEAKVSVLEEWKERHGKPSLREKRYLSKKRETVNTEFKELYKDPFTGKPHYKGTF